MSQLFKAQDPTNEMHYSLRSYAAMCGYVNDSGTNSIDPQDMFKAKPIKLKSDKAALK
jgi:hypothetical protein